MCWPILRLTITALPRRAHTNMPSASVTVRLVIRNSDLKTGGSHQRPEFDDEVAVGHVVGDEKIPHKLEVGLTLTRPATP